MKAASIAETILIVDDTPANISVLFHCLQDAGYRVLVAEDGETALKRVLYARPDVILLDVIMPGISGFETCRRLKADPVTEDIPIIFITALSETTDIVKGFQLGAVDYITKPLKQEEVLARVTTHLALRRLQRDLNDKVAELNAFAHTVAHDLKNPLSTVIGYADALLEYDTETNSEERQTMAQMISQSSQKLSKIIDELLLLAHLRQEDVKLEALDMVSIVNMALYRLGGMIEQYQPEIIMPQSWPAALGYSPWVEEIWANYLSNGIKYGGQPPRLEIGGAPQADGMVRFWLRDNGLGIAPEDQPKLFTLFTRLEQTRVQGHGLGLSIVRRIIEKLGGQAGVESEGIKGKGSVFYFTLPKVR